MVIKDVTPTPTISEEEMEMLGLEVDTEEYDENYVARRTTKDPHGNPLPKVVLNDLKPKTKVTGEPDFAIWINDEKEINGQKYDAKTWDTVNMRLFSDEDYLEIYINIPKVDENGVIHNIHKKNKFYENAFNLIFGYMRLANEDAVIDPDSDDGFIDHIKKINIKYLVEKLNELTDMEIKVTDGQNGYHGFIITEIWD